MTDRYSAAWIAACALVLAVASPVLAQDYTVTAPTNLYQAPPAQNTQIAIGNSQIVLVQMPFTFPYYGEGYTQVQVCSEGYIKFSLASSTVVPANAVFPRSGTSDGIVAVYWDDLALNVSGQVRHWTNGVAPNRTWVVGWENVAIAAQTTARISFQVRLSEDTGRIEFAYKPLSQQSTWLASTYTPGIDAAATGDNRFMTPPGMNVISNSGHPPTDFRFDPFVKQFTGTLLYDRVVADATGYGNSIQPWVPLSDVRVELRAQNGSFAGTGTTDAAGFFTVNGIALIATNTGSLNVTAQSSGARVATLPFGAVIARPIYFGFPFSSGRDVGIVTLSRSQDPGDTYLPALHVASVVGGALKSLQPLSVTPIGTLDMVYDYSSSLATQFSPPSAPNGGLLRIGGALSPNPDHWDTDVIIKSFAAGQVVGTLAAYPPPSLTQFDAISTPENAFAEGFGYAMFRAVTGRTSFVDATSVSTASVWDLETPSLATRKGPDVVGWLAASLCDLVDPANEIQDSIDGAPNPGELLIRVADAITGVPTSAIFHAAWGTAGYSGAGLTRNFVFHGVLADDGEEFNNAADEVAPLAAGSRKISLVLNQYDEDWYSVTIDTPTDSLGADVEYDRKALPTITVGLEIVDAGGTVIATGVPGPGYLPITAITAPVPAGTYRVRVSHGGGPRLDTYNLQIYRRIQVTTSFPAGWTVDRPLLIPIGVTGGVPPYTLRVEEPFIQPPGIIFDAVNGLARGAPTLVGPYGFIITAFDGGTPTHDGSVIVQSFIVNPELALDFRGFVGMSIGRSNSELLARTGGTLPFDFDVTGELPPGVTISPSDLRLTGTVTGQGVWNVHLSGADLAGSPAQGDTAIVACSPPSEDVATVHVDPAATAVGFAFDALAGSRVSVVVKTARGGAKRALVAHVVTAGGAPVTGGRIAGGSGKASAASLLCPVSGRYYVILETGPGAATDLLGSVKISPPRAGHSSVDRFSPGDTIDVPFGALEGALLTFSANSGQKSNLKVVPIGLIRPDGVPVPLTGLVEQKATSFRLRAPLGKSGTWIVRLGAITGIPTGISWSYSVKQPRGVLFSIDD